MLRTRTFRREKEEEDEDRLEAVVTEHIQDKKMEGDSTMENTVKEIEVVLMLEMP